MARQRILRTNLPIAGSSTPLYQLLRNEITRNLKDGTLRAGEAIPAEAEIRIKYGVSVGTVRKAIDQLVADGLLVRQQGRGTFVAIHDRERTLHNFFRIASKNGHKEVPQGRLISYTEYRADPDLAEYLRLKPGAMTIAFRNLLSLSGDRVIVDDIFLPQHLFPTLTAEILENRNDEPIYFVYQSMFNVNVISIFEYLTAISAEKDVASLLEIPRDAPILKIERVAVTYDDEPVEFRRRYVTTNKHEYVNDPR